MKKFRQAISKYPLWMQSAVVFTAVSTLIITILIINNFNYNRNTVLDTQISHTGTVLNLEMDTIEQYIKDLTSFAIQPCYDSAFIGIIESRNMLSDPDIDYVKNQMKYYYFTRSDLSSYEIFFLNKDLRIGRSRNSQHINAVENPEISSSDTKAFEECASDRFYLAIEPSDDRSEFLTFYHSIIQINSKASMAIVKTNVNSQFLKSLVRNYNFRNGEFLVILNKDNDLIYSGNETLMNRSDGSLLALTKNLHKDTLTDHSTIALNGQKFIATYVTRDDYGITIASLIPYETLSRDFRDIFMMCVLQGVFLWIAAIFVMYLLSRMIMSPIGTLSTKLKEVGYGNFDSHIELDGSREIVNLTESFNEMTDHIDTLIKENYVAKLNEQTSRLIALEAQINPHFLYNTLQAISTEALINDQMQIHEMVTSLASILRYSIKGGDFVTLAEELEHVKRYFYLQKIRMDENLNYEIEISDDAALTRIPKISIQTLAENSIIHGIGGDVTSISIRISAFIKDETVNIIVSDNGCGMDENRLAQLRESFNVYVDSGETAGIGLANLYSRLKIMYKEAANMTVESTVGEGTTISIVLPASGTD